MKVPRQTLKGAEHPELFAPSCLRCVYTVWFYYGMQAGDVPKGTNFFPNRKNILFAVISNEFNVSRAQTHTGTRTYKPLTSMANLSLIDKTVVVATGWTQLCETSELMDQQMET